LQSIKTEIDKISVSKNLMQIVGDPWTPEKATATISGLPYFH
jgi:hypothetical protein